MPGEGTFLSKIGKFAVGVYVGAVGVGRAMSAVPRSVNGRGSAREDEDGRGNKDNKSENGVNGHFGRIVKGNLVLVRNKIYMTERKLSTSKMVSV